MMVFVMMVPQTAMMITAQMMLIQINGIMIMIQKVTFVMLMMIMMVPLMIMIQKIIMSLYAMTMMLILVMNV